MILQQTEISKFAKVGRAAVSKWVKAKKLQVDKDGKIDTSLELNRLFLEKKAPSIYGIEQKTKENEIFDLIENNDNCEKIPNDLDIESLSHEDCKKYLNIILHENPKQLLLTAQYKKADIDKQIKKIELDEKKNRKFDRDFVITHFVEILNIYYTNRRQIPYSVVDDVINLVITKGVDSRNEIIEIFDNKFIEEIDNANKKLVDLIKVKYPEKK